MGWIRVGGPDATGHAAAHPGTLRRNEPDDLFPGTSISPQRAPVRGGYGERAGVEAGDLLFPFVRARVRALVGPVSGTSHTRTPAFPC